MGYYSHKNAMIKRLIFDIDDTLIPWKNEYEKVVDDILEEIQYPHIKELYIDINNIVYEYEKDRKYFDKKEMVNFINKNLNLNLPENFVDLWNKKAPYCVPQKMEKEDYETLEYLCHKYELVILTNWFKEYQIERLKKLGVLNFFKEVYGSEKYAKPYKESFIQATGKWKIKECAMIGDDFKIDIKGAKNAGIEKIVWKDNRNEKEKYTEFLKGVDIITKISELRQIF